MNFGSIELATKSLIMRAEPHVLLRAKRIFAKASKTEVGQITLSLTPDTCKDVTWFIDRYPMQMDVITDMVITTMARAYDEKILRMRDFLHPDYKPPQIQLALPAREYQLQASKLMLENKFLLLADDVGLGKTCSSICNFVDQNTLPAAVITLTHLPQQWRDEIKKFLPALRTWIPKDGKVKPIPLVDGKPPDVVITSYSKLDKWAEVFSNYAKTVVFDEAQALRRPETARYQAAKLLATSCEYRYHLTATPIYNYGGEIFHVIDIIAPGVLGTFEEFVREWCEYQWVDGTNGGASRQKLIVKDTKALGTFLRENFIMLRRTRADAKRELPPCQNIIQDIDCNMKALDEIKIKATELAKIILSQREDYKGQKLQASEEFSNKLRQATGIAKAPYAAEFIKILLDQEEKVLVGVWHREVYKILMEMLDEFNPVMFSGSESTNQKLRAKDAFVNGNSRVMLISLRAGAGLDGLQHVCRTGASAELDWSPGVHEQLTGRIFRDGQPDPVTWYFLVTHAGADPIMMDVLGLKTQQAAGIVNPKQDDLQRMIVDHDKIKRLAKAYLEKNSR